MTGFTSGIQFASVVSILIPIILCITILKNADRYVKLFFLFLIIGLIADVVMYSLGKAGITTYLPLIFNIYSLVESLFFYWFIYRCTQSRHIKLICKAFFFITPSLWVAFVLVSPLLISTNDVSSQIFDMVYEIMAAFLAGFVLLEIVEKGDSIFIKFDFWILLGIFFYCFCTFFIMGFLNTALSQKIWFMNNIINIITYIFYSIGLLKLRPR